MSKISYRFWLVKAPQRLLEPLSILGADTYGFYSRIPFFPHVEPDDYPGNYPGHKDRHCPYEFGD